MYWKSYFGWDIELLNKLKEFLRHLYHGMTRRCGYIEYFYPKGAINSVYSARTKRAVIHFPRRTVLKGHHHLEYTHLIYTFLRPTTLACFQHTGRWQHG